MIRSSCAAELIAPTTRLYASWHEARDEWGRGVHQDGSGLRDTDDVDTAAGFAAWVERLRGEADGAGEGRVPATYWWIVDGDRYLGAITLRHELTDFLLRAGGHIGYGIRPSARGRGLATWALGAPDAVTAVATPAANGINGQLSIALATPAGGTAALQCTVLADTPVTASIAGVDGRVEIGRYFYRPGPFTVHLRSGETLHWDEPRVDHDALHFEAAEVARRVTVGETGSG